MSNNLKNRSNNGQIDWNYHLKLIYYCLILMQFIQITSAFNDNLPTLSTSCLSCKLTPNLADNKIIHNIVNQPRLASIGSNQKIGFKFNQIYNFLSIIGKQNKFKFK